MELRPTTLHSKTVFLKLHFLRVYHGRRRASRTVNCPAQSHRSFSPQYFYSGKQFFLEKNHDFLRNIFPGSPRKLPSLPLSNFFPFRCKVPDPFSSLLPDGKRFPHKLSGIIIIQSYAYGNYDTFTIRDIPPGRPLQWSPTHTPVIHNNKQRHENDLHTHSR